MNDLSRVAGAVRATYDPTTDFISRHIGPSDEEQARMLAALGVTSLDALIEKVVPAGIRDAAPLALAAPRAEHDVLAELGSIAAENRVVKSLIGMGYSGTITPPVILRNVLENPAWYTAYTPYQPEISQGRLEALLNFQTMVCDLTGMQIANASLLDEGTAAAEAMTLAQRMAKSQAATIIVGADCHPQTIAVLRTRAEPLGIAVEVGDVTALAREGEYFAALVQYPSTSGEIRDYAALVEAAHAKGALVIAATDLLALTLLKPPGEWGADIVVGNSQRFGVPLGYGGPHAAFLATRDAFKRSLPGRLIGVTIDEQGRPAYRLTLQTREQHIRREKATSNICTAQVLLAVIASMYAVYHGPDRLRGIAARVHALAARFAGVAQVLGVPLKHAQFFDTVTLVTADRTDSIVAAALARGYNLRKLDSRHVSVAFDETCDESVVRALAEAFAREVEQAARALEQVYDDSYISSEHRRTSEFLTHVVFNSHQSETQMLRYLRSLADKDIALDRAMIPLGSCTMKLNATAEMIPVTWPEFVAIHPFAPRDQAQGYARLTRTLEQRLCAITGFDAVSLQPNSGAQGEYAGLLAIRAWHRSRGQGHRNVCLIPSSAHGTNPASAHMVGMEVVVVRCDDRGNVDVADVKTQAEKHRDDLAALMITYPSTHGVFEEAIRDICAIVHAHGGQVYMDGANLNALVGVAKPGEFGADVSHMNLHKTFCIPHGGGGPGVGPIGVKAHLAPFLPSTAPLSDATAPVGPVSAAPWGSASILPISYAYIAMMGAAGLRKATQVAILNANYMAKQLAPHFPVLYTGPNGMVAHECIIDLRALKDATGITNTDVAKRLMDYGFHAPTVSFPVPGTLMIEPTESESKEELDRFCEAMIAIREEIRAVETGVWSRDDNPLKHAPHTAAALLSEGWKRGYSREQAAFPLPYLRQQKYWPPVGRVDEAHGDRNVMCTCPPIESFA